MRGWPGLVVFLLVGGAMIGLWLWGAISIFRRRSTVREIVREKMPAAGSGSLIDAMGNPSTGHAHLSIAALYCVIYGTAAFFGFIPAGILIPFSIITAAWGVNRIRNTIGFSDHFAIGAMIIYTATIAVSIAGFIIR